MAKHRKKKLKMTKKAIAARRRYRKHRGRVRHTWGSSKSYRRKLRGGALRAHLRKRSRILARHKRSMRKERRARRSRNPFAFLSKKLASRAAVAQNFVGAGRRDNAAREAWMLKQAALGGNSVIAPRYR